MWAFAFLVLGVCSSGIVTWATWRLFINSYFTSAVEDVEKAIVSMAVDLEEQAKKTGSHVQKLAEDTSRHVEELAGEAKEQLDAASVQVQEAMADFTQRSESVEQRSREAVQLLLEDRASAPGTLISDEIMAALEARPDLFETVLIVRTDGPDEFFDHPDLRSNMPNYSEVVRNNLERGIRYCWICKRSAQSSRAIREAEKDLSQFADLLTFYEQGPAEWSQLPTTFETVFLIYPSGLRGEAYVRMPTQSDADTTWYPLPEKMALYWIAELWHQGYEPTDTVDVRDGVAGTP